MNIYSKSGKCNEENQVGYRVLVYLVHLTPCTDRFKIHSSFYGKFIVGKAIFNNCKMTYVVGRI